MADHRDRKGRWQSRRKVEKILGKKLPRSVEIHHCDGDQTNLNNTNLVVCQDKEYHNLIHRRTEAYIATGDPHKRRCSYCQEYDNPENMYQKSINGFVHTYCHKEYMRTYDDIRFNRSCPWPKTA